jgi:excisionase family DNA binding protein
VAVEPVSSGPGETELQLEGRITLTVSEAAELLSISRSTAYAAAKSGQLPVLRLGRRLVVPVPALRKLLGVEVLAVESTSLAPRESRIGGSP